MNTTSSTSVGKRLKTLRENRDMTLEDLAGEVGCDQEYLRKLENNDFRPPVAMLIGLAQALKVDSMVLLRDSEPQEADSLSTEAVTKRTANYSYELLAQEHLQKRLKSFLVTIEPAKALDGPGYQHKGEEYHYVLKGEVMVRVGDKTHRLKKGDSLYFDSSRVHTLENPGQETCEILVVLYTP